MNSFATPDSTFVNHPHYAAALRVFRELKVAAFEVYFAGGCVRDFLLKRPVNDFDLASSAPPEGVQKLFPKTLDIGKKFGVIHVIIDGVTIEVTTFRQDGNYGDGRRPDQVLFSSPQEDAARRDFTINALFFDPDSGKIFDFVDGVKDLDQKIIRAVGDPALRFAEDHLRLLRALRFQAQLGFSIEEKTLQAIDAHFSDVTSVSKERIFQELQKIIGAPFWTIGLSSIFKHGGLPFLKSPDWTLQKNNRFHSGAKFVDSCSKALEKSDLNASETESRKIFLRWYLTLTHLQMTPGQTIELLENYPFGSQLRKSLKEAISVTEKTLIEKPLGFWIERAFQEDLHLVLDWIRVGSNPPCSEKMNDRIQQILNRMQSFKVKPKPWIQAADLPPTLKGAQIGTTLQKFYYLQLEGVIQNRDQAFHQLKGEFGNV